MKLHQLPIPEPRKTKVYYCPSEDCKASTTHELVAYEGRYGNKKPDSYYKCVSCHELRKESELVKITNQIFDDKVKKILGGDGK